MDPELNASQKIDELISRLPEWQARLVARLREVVGSVDPELKEEWKWGTPVWSLKGNILSVGVFKNHMKMHFFEGAALPDPHGLFNAGLDAKMMRGIDFKEGDVLNEAALKELIAAAVALHAGNKR